MIWKSKRLGILLLILLVLGMAVLNTGAKASGISPGDPDKGVIASHQTLRVSPNTAKYLARTELNRLPFSELRNAEVGKMTLFYFPDGRPAYYEVPLLKGGKVIGIMFVPALKTMPPTWMQVFKGNIPISQQLDKLAKERGITHYRYVVLGAAIFGIQKEDGTVIDMAGREYKIDPNKPFKFAIESEGNVGLWDSLTR